MSTKTMKILTTIATIILILAIGTSIVYGDTTPLDIQPATDGAGVNQVKDLGGKLMGVLQTVGVVVAVIILIVLGIKYMKAQPEERGKLKQQLIGLVISGIVIFGAFTIWRIAYNFFEEIF